MAESEPSKDSSMALKLDEEDDLTITIAAYDKAILDETIDLDSIFVSAMSARLKQDISVSHLSKMWQIDLESAKQTLEVTTQQCQ